MTAAAPRADLKPDTDFRVSITNAAGADAYPDLLVHLAPDPARAARQREGRADPQLREWMLKPEAQRMAADLHYAPLPVPVIELVQKLRCRD